MPYIEQASGLAVCSELPCGPSLSELEIAAQPAHTYLFCESERAIRQPFFHAEQIDSATASFGSLFTDPNFCSYNTPRTTASALPSASVLGSSGLVLWEGKLLADSLQSIESWRSETIVAEADAVRAKLKRRVYFPGQKLTGHWFHIFTGAWRNYAHWMTECMPKLLLFWWLREHVPGLKLILPDFGNSHFHLRTLQLFGIDETMIFFVKEDDIVTPDVLWYAPIISLWGLQPICKIAAQHLAMTVLRQFHSTTLLSERIFIRRSAAMRRIVNFEALAPILQNYGFTVITPESMTLDEQIQVMQNARCVIGEHGAGVANLMFCRAGSRVLEIFNSVGAQPAHWVLASICEVGYGYLIASHAPTSQQPKPDANSDYIVLPKQLIDGIHRLISN